MNNFYPQITQIKKIKALREVEWVILHRQPPFGLIISWNNRLFFPWETCIDEPMATTRQLRDVYRFPGFEPLATVRGIFGDPYAVVVSLQRRRKKPPAECVGKHRSLFTIEGHGRSATFPVATNVSTSRSRFVGCNVRGVSP